MRGPVAHLMEAAVTRCALNLRGLSVLTEAATGPYAVTASLAAMAGAEKVYAFTTRPEAIEETAALARDLGLADRVEFPSQLTSDILGAADIVTNTGYLRPLTSSRIEALKPTAVIPLMYESWEFRATDLDLNACRARNIPVAGTNECHPSVDVFSFLGPLAVHQLREAGLRPRGLRVQLLCDNPFEPHIRKGLEAAGCTLTNSACDAIVVALRPTADLIDLTPHAAPNPGALVAQFWGDIDRESAIAAGFRFWPQQAPKRGHMGILPSALGPDPIIRLQSGGLKVGELLARHSLDYAVASGFGQRL